MVALTREDCLTKIDELAIKELASYSYSEGSRVKVFAYRLIIRDTRVQNTARSPGREARSAKLVGVASRSAPNNLEPSFQSVT